MRPYFGGGLVNIFAEIEGSSFGVKVSDDDTGLGFWVDGGIYFSATEHLNLGVNLRFSDAEVNLFGVDGEAGGVHLHFLIGYHW